MLVKIGTFILLFWAAGQIEAKQVAPDVFVVSLLEKGRVEGVGELLAKRELKLFHGQVASMTSMLYGVHPLQCGVVSELDWRRKPIQGESILNQYQKVGYTTCFYGAWGLGVNSPYTPKDRGADHASVFFPSVKKTLNDPWGKGSACLVGFDSLLRKEKPLACFLSEGRSLKRERIFKLLHASVRKNRAQVVIVISPNAKKGVFPYWKNGKLMVFTTGLNETLKKSIQVSSQEAFSQDDVYSLLEVVLGAKDSFHKKEIAIFHQSGWGLHESAEKYQHRGSLVLSDKFALRNGLDLFAKTSKKNPSFSNMLDISEYPHEHQKLLSNYGKWWKKASIAIHNPRAFDVMDGKVIKLTALDWRKTRIIHKDGSALASEPMVEQEKLMAILQGLRSNEAYKESFPAYSGSWSLNIKQPGRYKITASLLPILKLGPKIAHLAKLEGGRAHVRLGRNEVQLRLAKGATSISVLLDADKGVTDLECWFTGQLSLNRELGAFFVQIERVGEKKFDLDIKTKS